MGWGSPGPEPTERVTSSPSHPGLDEAQLAPWGTCKVAGTTASWVEARAYRPMILFGSNHFRFPLRDCRKVCPHLRIANSVELGNGSALWARTPRLGALRLVPSTRAWYSELNFALGRSSQSSS